MKNREEILVDWKLQEMFQALIDIQNKGIATVMFRFMGHTNNVDIDLHSPRWVDGTSAAWTRNLFLGLEDISKVDDVLEELESIIRGETDLTLFGKQAREKRLAEMKAEIAILEGKDE